MKIFVLGHRGMLGRYVYTYLKSKGHSVVGLSRNDIDAERVTYGDGTFLTGMLYYKGIRKDDIIINCIGTIKPQVDKLGTITAIKVNALFPHLLSEVCKKEGYKMLHITTDCAFSGRDGYYTENSPHDCTDVYGKTKSLGEPEDCTIIRTSIIGEEVNSCRSLIEWIKSMKNKTANGYTNHLWNGITCLQVAKIFEDIIVNNKYWKGVKHIYTKPISKYELVQMVNKIYELNITVNPVEATIPCNRTLSTIFKEDILFDIPLLGIQVQDQRDFYSTLTSDL